MTLLFLFSLVFSQSLLSLDIIEDFLAHIDEMNQNPDEADKKDDKDKDKGEKKDEAKKGDKKGKENGEVAGGSGAGGSGDGPEKKEDKVRYQRTCDCLKNESDTKVTMNCITLCAFVSRKHTFWVSDLVRQSQKKAGSLCSDS